MTKTTLAVPDEVANAVRHEALRQMRRPSEVLTQFLQWGWPSFIKERLASDLNQPADRQASPTLRSSGDDTEHAQPVTGGAPSNVGVRG